MLGDYKERLRRGELEGAGSVTRETILVNKHGKQQTQTSKDGAPSPFSTTMATSYHTRYRVQCDCGRSYTNELWFAYLVCQVWCVLMVGEVW